MKINRFTCGNGEGMFENKKGYWVSYEYHLKALKELEEDLTIPVVSRSVWMVQNNNTLLIHGLFSTQQKAINFAGTSESMVITNITVDG